MTGPELPPGSHVTAHIPVRPGEGPLGGMVVPQIDGAGMIHLVRDPDGGVSYWIDGSLDAGRTYLGYLFLCDDASQPRHFHFAARKHRDRPGDWMRLGAYCWVQPAISPDGAHGWAWGASVQAEKPATCDVEPNRTGWTHRRAEAVREANDAALLLARTFHEWTEDDQG